MSGITKNMNEKRDMEEKDSDSEDSKAQLSMLMQGKKLNGGNITEARSTLDYFEEKPESEERVEHSDEMKFQLSILNHAIIEHTASQSNLTYNSLMVKGGFYPDFFPELHTLPNYQWPSTSVYFYISSEG